MIPEPNIIPEKKTKKTKKKNKENTEMTNNEVMKFNLKDII